MKFKFFLLGNGRVLALISPTSSTAVNSSLLDTINNLMASPYATRLDSPVCTIRRPISFLFPVRTSVKPGCHRVKPATHEPLVSSRKRAGIGFAQLPMPAEY